MELTWATAQAGRTENPSEAGVPRTLPRTQRSPSKVSRACIYSDEITNHFHYGDLTYVFQNRLPPMEVLSQIESFMYLNTESGRLGPHKCPWGWPGNQKHRTPEVPTGSPAPSISWSFVPYKIG